MKALNVIKFIFFAVGLGLMGGGFFWYQSVSSFVAQAARTEGKVIELARSRSNDSTTYAPVVTFTAQNGEAIEFVSSVSSNPPSYSVGEKVQVLYAPTSPQDARIDGLFSLWGGPMIVGGIGFVFVDIALVFMVMGLVGARRKDHLLAQGVPIDTEFQSVQLNSSLKVGSRSPYRIFTQWQNPSTGEIHVFESENLWFDPTDYVDGKRIRVYIEQNNPRKYYVDVSFLPKQAQ